MIAIIDYGICNVMSIYNMLKKIRVKDVTVTNSPSNILSADKLILPGVGSYDMGMGMLKKAGFIDVIYEFTSIGKPMLGICLGMQMLGKESEEGKENGLGLIDFSCQKLKPGRDELLVPHMGWEYVSIKKKKSRLVENMADNPRFYFVHSYYAVCGSQDDVLMTCEYGGIITAAVQHGNIYGTQFHPEKSHKFGMQILKNFVEIC